jgi:hypothetical protein
MAMRLIDRLRRVARYYEASRGLWRELLAAALCLALGVLLVPCLVYAAGNAALGAYARGSLIALWHDYLHGLITGLHAAWFLALGPYALLWLWRSGRWLLHNRPRDAAPP